MLKVFIEQIRLNYASAKRNKKSKKNKQDVVSFLKYFLF